MSTEITPTGIKFDGYDVEQTKPICSVGLVEPDESGNVSLDLSSIQSEIDLLESEVASLEQNSNPSKILTLEQSSTFVDEIGSVSPVTITLTTSNVYDGGKIPYTITTNGIDLTDDFVYPISANGNFVIQNNSSTLLFYIKQDFLTEDTEESFTLTLNESTNPPVPPLSVTVNINDTSITPVITVTPEKSSVDEGSPLTINVSASYVPDGTTLYWSINAVDLSEDFYGYAYHGQFTVTGTFESSTGVFTVTPKPDYTTESGTDDFTVSIRTGSYLGPVVATTYPIIINDTSQDPVPTYTITTKSWDGLQWFENPPSINEGDFLVLNVSTTFVQPGTILYITFSPPRPDDLPYSYMSLQVTGTFEESSGSQSLTPAIADNTTESETDYVTFSLRTGSATGPVVATTGPIIINDTSQDP